MLKKKRKAKVAISNFEFYILLLLSIKKGLFV